MNPERRHKGVIVSLTLALCLVAGGAQAAEEALTVKRVIDGDSLLLSDGREVRLIGVDTPEFRNPHRNFVNARRLGVDPDAYSGYADKAAGYTRQVALGRAVRIEHDPANAASGHKDKYGRELAYVYLKTPGGPQPGPPEEELNALLVSSGNAVTTTGFTFAGRDRFLKLQEEARRQKRGFWRKPAQNR